MKTILWIRGKMLFIGILLSIITLISFQNCSKEFQVKDVTSEVSISDLKFSTENLFRVNNTYLANGTAPDIKLETGQVVGFRFFFSPMINAVTGSLFDHVGIIVVKNNIPYLYDSDMNWKKREFFEISNLSAKDLAIMAPVEKLTDAEKNRLVEVLDSLVLRGANMYNYGYLSNNPDNLDYGKPGDTKNDLTKKACSEFVRYAFIRAGIPGSSPGVGRVQKISELANITNNNEPLNKNLVAEGLLLNHIYKFYGAHESMNNKEYWAVSPDSIMNDPKLKLVYTSRSFGGRYLSEQEALSSFKSYSNVYNLAKSPRQEYPQSWNQVAYSVTDGIGGTVVVEESESSCDLKWSSDSQQRDSLVVNWDCKQATSLNVKCRIEGGNFSAPSILPFSGTATVPNRTQCVVTTQSLNVNIKSKTYDLLFARCSDLNDYKTICTPESVPSSAAGISTISCPDDPQSPVLCANYAGQYGIPTNATRGNASWTRNRCTGEIKYTEGCY